MHYTFYVYIMIHIWVLRVMVAFLFFLFRRKTFLLYILDNTNKIRTKHCVCIYTLYIYIHVYFHFQFHFSSHLYNAESFIICLFTSGGMWLKPMSRILMNQTNLSVVKLSLIPCLPGYADHLMHGSSLYFPVFPLC